MGEQNKPVIRVAYAEDHDLVRDAIVENLAKYPFIEIIIEAENGTVLLDKIEQCQIKPDVCLMDIAMPGGMDGFEAVCEIKKRWPEMKVLVVSSHDEEEYLIKMILCGAEGYLTKNTRQKEMVAAIEGVYEYGFYNTELFTPQLLNDVRSGKLVLPPLTAKEIQLLKSSIADKTFEEIGAEMGLSKKSVESHRMRLYAKLGVKSRIGLAIFAIRFGYYPIDPGAAIM